MNVGASQKLRLAELGDFKNLLGATTERFVLEDVYDYEEAFEQAYGLITAKLDRRNEVWVNVAAMPRMVSFAFATAANSLIADGRT